MPLCAFDDNYFMMGVTPVENMFIQNYLPRAAGDYVRVYLYGLMQCHHPDSDMTPERMAHLLDLSEETVLSAFAYWERQGIVRRVSDRPPQFQYLNIAMTLGDESPMEKAVYRHRDFNNSLQQIFGTRLLHPADFETACEWVEELHLPEEVVLVMAQAEVEKRGRSVRFSQLGKTALSWAEQKITTRQAALELIARDGAASRVASRVLKQFNTRRSPTLDEIELSRKWLEDWGLDEDAIVRACGETTKAQNPTFKYLDKILERNRGARSRSDMDQRLHDEQTARDAVKALREALGQPMTTPTPDELASYRNYLAAGFEPAAIQRMAAAIGRERPGHYGMDTLDSKMADMLEKGLLTDDALKAYLDRQAELRAQALKVFELCDYRSNVTAASTVQMEAWLDMADYALILYAAERARGTKLPLQYISKLLREWKKAGISTVEAARAAQPSAAAAPAARVNPALAYTQRAYTIEEANDVFSDPSQYEEAKPDEAQ